MTDDQALGILVVLGDSRRFEIFRRLLDTAGLSSGELSDGKAASSTSHHLKMMQRVGLIRSVRRGKKICHVVCKETLAEFAKWAREAAENATFAYLTDILENSETR
ncbi:helix-turn-helix domain-containing protein [uncultured Devosia sp.]|uniref:ArsR/SmtB family transcription factor n=1 Tax=uncultured Devosia sp. TaxID=211434 RepID=UPI0030ECF014|tara:strand:- start:8623 stop:8940 length:318 start_codon:yes stop_codon:yes gene_type:complete